MRREKRIHKSCHEGSPNINMRWASVGDLCEVFTLRPGILVYWGPRGRSTGPLDYFTIGTTLDEFRNKVALRSAGVDTGFGGDFFPSSQPFSRLKAMMAGDGRGMSVSRQDNLSSRPADIYI